MKKFVLAFFIATVFVPLATSVAHADFDATGVQEKFTITGYYSPLPTQEFFLTGSYESEIRLNGRGTNGADGTPVFPGMIAAPASYDFGLKVCIPNFGCGAIHDRGGAIVKKGERDLARHDRLDLWMGYGMEGMQRALSWGVQHVDCEVYSAESDVATNVNFSVPPALVQILDLPGRSKFIENISRGDRGNEAKELQTALLKLGFYSGEADGFFDYDTENAVFEFQKKNFLVETFTDPGAGTFGPQTRDKLSEVLYRFEIQEKIYELWQKFNFDEQMQRGQRSADVLKLQQILVEHEFMDVAPTGFFGPVTEKSLKKFQIAHELILSEFSPGAGKVGAETREKLNEILSEKNAELASEKSEILAYQNSQQKLAVLAQRTHENSRSLALGDRGTEVQKLQFSLRELGYFSTAANGFFGESTQTAVTKFQLDHDVIRGESFGGAGTFGPATRAKFLEVLRG
ncbi:hypothetical protein HN954_03580 [bacterium]|jgi:peptidoglycan hydrolase-like protein with peptidoglycan-binding domain|nr:hypothetical protein [bacterium]MBT6996484.1 hypothetical protein [bacterium]MBT7772498.1 hypothetical protein [bacterium]